MSDETKSATVTLSEPIVLGETTITDLTLRKPKGGDLRGLSVQELVQGDANAMMSLVPRICTPTITSQHVAEMEVDDFASVANAVVGFFMSKSQKAMLAQLQGQA